MPNKSTVEAAKEDLREGKSASTAAGEFVHEEIEHVRENKHGARSPQQAIAIGLSKARRAGIPLKPPARGKTSETTRKRSERDYEKGQSEPKTREEGSTKRGDARLAAMEREPKSTASHKSLSAHSRTASRQRSKSQRHAAAEKAVRTKGESGLRAAARKAAHTRARHS
jgi:hypothetical protein